MVQKYDGNRCKSHVLKIQKYYHNNFEVSKMLDLLHIPGPEVFLPHILPFPHKTSENPCKVACVNSWTAWTGLFTFMKSKSAPFPFGGAFIYHIRTLSGFFWFSQMNLGITSGPFHCHIAFCTLREIAYISLNSHLS